MEKPMNQDLRRVAELLDERNVEYDVETRYDLLFVEERLCVYDVYGHYQGAISPNGDGVRLDSISIPVEGAVMAICGPDRRLEDEYPAARKHMSFGGVSMNLETDRRDVLLPIQKAELLKERIDALNGKADNQRKELRRLHLKCMRQQDEIARMEDNALCMAVLHAGYSEGES